jgi:DnaK suppressor protein
MKAKETEFFKLLLLQRLEDIQQRGKDTISLISGQAIQYPDPLDRATIESDQNFLLRIKSRESRLAQKIKESLERIKDGSFGICETCEEKISIARLKARPVTTQCIECKIKAEKIEKVSG